MTGEASNQENNHMAVITDDIELHLNNEALHLENYVERYLGRPGAKVKQPHDLITHYLFGMRMCTGLSGTKAYLYQ